jgi:hypothetical protein
VNEIMRAFPNRRSSDIIYRLSRVGGQRAMLDTEVHIQRAAVSLFAEAKKHAKILMLRF